jgi:hypothetical protein
MAAAKNPQNNIKAALTFLPFTLAEFSRIGNAIANKRVARICFLYLAPRFWPAAAERVIALLYNNSRSHSVCEPQDEFL